MKLCQVLVRNIQIPTECIWWQCKQFWRISIAYETKTKWQFRKLKLKNTPRIGLCADWKLENTNSGIAPIHIETQNLKKDWMLVRSVAAVHINIAGDTKVSEVQSVNVRQATAIAPEPKYNYKNTSGELGNNASWHYTLARQTSASHWNNQMKT